MEMPVFESRHDRRVDSRPQALNNDFLNYIPLIIDGKFDDLVTLSDIAQPAQHRFGTGDADCGTNLLSRQAPVAKRTKGRTGKRRRSAGSITYRVTVGFM